MKGILGKKMGMTQVFTTDGVLIPVTVIAVEPNVVTQIKTKDHEGYDAVQLGFSTKREKLSNKPELGHVQKAKTTPKRFLREIRGVDVSNYQLGDEIKVDIFESGEVVDVTGTSKGKGFQGVIKRHGYARGPMGHGSHHHRKPGSLGSIREKRVMPGKKMSGHMGVETVTIQNLEIVKVDLDNNLLLVKGNVPGPKKSLVIIKSAVKKGDINKKKERDLVSYMEEETPEQPNVVASEETIKTKLEEEKESVDQPKDEVVEAATVDQPKAEDKEQPQEEEQAPVSTEEKPE
jgi:large subunit ribosomal protein L3